MTSSDEFQNTLSQFLPQDSSFINGSIKRKGGASKKDLEVAFTVLLVDLATCDQNFDPREYQVISHALMNLFGTTPQQVKELINRAQLVIQNLRGTSKFAELLRENLDLDQKKAILQVIDNVIDADDAEDGFETYLKHKFRDLLGFETATEAE